MKAEKSFTRMDINRFREVAEEWHLLDAGQLTGEEWESALKRAADLEGEPLNELRAIAKAYGVAAASRMGKRALVIELLKAEALGAMRVRELRRLAERQGIVDTQRWKKPDFIRVLLNREGPTSKEAPGTPEVAARDAPSPRSMRLLGNAIRFAGGMGFIISLVGAVLLPFATMKAIATSKGFLLRAGEEATMLKTSLEHVQRSLESAVQVMEATVETLATAAQSMEDNIPLIESLSALVGEQAPTTIETTRKALIAAEDGARAIDQVLRGLARISLLTGVTYDPDQPLDQSFAQVAKGLEPLPPILVTVGGDIGELAVDLDQLAQELPEMAGQLEAFGMEVATLQDGLQGFAVQLGESELFLKRAAERLPARIWGIFVLMELALIWLGLGQCAIFYVGRQISGSASL